MDSTGLPLGRPRCEAEDDLGFVAEGVLDGGKGLADAGVVGDVGEFAVLGDLGRR
jgi:hypothetical protein